MAGSVDHITPHSTRGAGKWATESDTVPACKECNSLLGDNFPYNLAERITYLAKRFSWKNKLHRAFIEWDEEELSEMSGIMSRWIAAKQVQRTRNEQRLAHITLRALEARVRDEEKLGDP